MSGVMPGPGALDFVLNPLDGVRIAYRHIGTGPPVVLVHGTALSQVIWRGFGYVRDLSADHTVITLDLRGHGRSDKPQDESGYGQELFVSDVLTVLDRLEVEQADYLGYSLGGRIGFSLLDSVPTRVRRFVSVAGAAGNSPGAFDRLFFPGCIPTLETGGIAGFLAGWEAHSGRPLDRATRAAIGANDPVALAAYMRRSEQDVGVSAQRLGELSVPTLLLVGSQDQERLAAAERVRTLVPAASLQVIAGAGHADVLRHPEALPAVRAFLTG